MNSNCLDKSGKTEYTALVFQIAAVVLLPLVWGIDGIWISIVAAECMAVVVTIIFLIIKQKKYHY